MIKITQGKQNANIIAKNVEMQIINVAMADPMFNANSIRVTMKIMSGDYAGRLISDTVCYDPTSKMAFRYLNLRKAVGRPYVASEPEIIDIEEILMNKALRVDLDERTSESTGKTYQTVNYVFSKDNAHPTEDTKPKSKLEAVIATLEESDDPDLDAIFGEPQQEEPNGEPGPKGVDEELVNKLKAKYVKPVAEEIDDF